MCHIQAESYVTYLLPPRNITDLVNFHFHSDTILHRTTIAGLTVDDLSIHFDSNQLTISGRLINPGVNCLHLRRHRFVQLEHRIIRNRPIPVNSKEHAIEHLSVGGASSIRKAGKSNRQQRRTKAFLNSGTAHRLLATLQLLNPRGASHYTYLDPISATSNRFHQRYCQAPCPKGPALLHQHRQLRIPQPSSAPQLSRADLPRLRSRLSDELNMTLESDLAAAMTALPAKRSVHDTHSPARAMPARMSTPPPPCERGRLEAKPNGDIVNTRSSRHIRRDGSISNIDPEILSRALSRELSADRRDSAPASSPSRKRQRINGDRLVYI